MTNQRHGWCKTGCRGKVVYNAGPEAGGDRQELAVAGSGLPCSLGSVSSENMGPDGHHHHTGEKNVHFAEANILSIYKIKNN